MNDKLIFKTTVSQRAGFDLGERSGAASPFIPHIAIVAVTVNTIGVIPGGPVHRAVPARIGSVGIGHGVDPDLELIDQVIITGLLSVWIFGFIFIWKKPVFAGWVFISWFILLLGTIIIDRGGLEYPVAGVVIGLPGLILGILFLLKGKKLQKTQNDIL
jgi:hypothetical protein